MREVIVIAIIQQWLCDLNNFVIDAEVWARSHAVNSTAKARNNGQRSEL